MKNATFLKSKTFNLILVLFVSLVSFNVFAEGNQIKLKHFNSIVSSNYFLNILDEISVVQEPFKVISYGEKIFFGTIDVSAKWAITNQKENILVYLKGNQINDYVFEKPGIYEITFLDTKKHNSEECNHPDFKEKTIIEVSPFKMTFDFSKIKFSKTIVGGKELQDIEISVDVFFESFDNQKATFTNANVSVAGVGANIVGSSINNKITLTSGINNIIYRLNGVATKDTYIMFDFLDIKGQVQSYSYPTKL